VIRSWAFGFRDQPAETIRRRLQSFVQLLSRQLATSLASVVLFEEEIRRGQREARIAALDRIKLSEQLAARTQEAAESETRFTRMAELSPVGMFIADCNGRINYCNDTWYKLSGNPKEDYSTENWMDSVKTKIGTWCITSGATSSIRKHQ
jgi:PAS domain-containing protein